MRTLLTPIDIQEMDALEILFQAYVNEMVQYVVPTSAKKLLKTSEHLGHYWSSDSHWPYFITYYHQPVGFCLIRRYPKLPDSFDIDQFFVAKEFKRKGIGRAALRTAIELHPGNWIIRVLTKNSPALSFWLDSVQSICGDNYQQNRELDREVEMDFIRFNYRAQ